MAFLKYDKDATPIVRVIETKYSSTRTSTEEKFKLIKLNKNIPIKVLQAINRHADYATVTAFRNTEATYYKFEEREPIAKISYSKNSLISTAFDIYNSEKKTDLLTVKIPKSWITKKNGINSIRKHAEKFKFRRMIELTKSSFPSSTLIFERYRGYKIKDKETIYYLGTADLEKKFRKLIHILETEGADENPIVSIELDYSNKVIVKRSTKNTIEKKAS